MFGEDTEAREAKAPEPTRKTVLSEIARLEDRVSTAKKLVFGEGQDNKADEVARPASSSLDRAVTRLDRLSKAMYRINRELELLK